MEKGELGLIITRGISTALSRYNPGMSIADCVLGQTFVGCAVLLSDFPVSLSTESTSLSSHPVRNFNLKKNPNSLEYALLEISIHIAFRTKRCVQIYCITFNAFRSKKTSWRPWLGACRAMPSPFCLI